LNAASFVRDTLFDAHKIMAPFLNPPDQAGRRTDADAAAGCANWRRLAATDGSMKMRALKALSVTLALMFVQPAFAASILKVLEFDGAGVSIPNIVPQMAPMPPLVEQTAVDFSGGAAQSAVLNAATRIVFLNCSVRCSFKFETGASSVTVNNTPLGADAPHYFSVIPSSGLKISVIASP
jgi:hypothetical protein